MPRSETDAPLDPAQLSLMRRMRRLMLLSSFIMAAGFLAVFGVIAYRLSVGAESRPAETNVPLPRGARVISTAVANGTLAVTLDVAGVTEIRLFDLATLQPRGRIVLTPQQ